MEQQECHTPGPGPDGAPCRGDGGGPGIPGIVDGQMTVVRWPDGSASIRMSVGGVRQETGSGDVVELTVGAGERRTLGEVLGRDGDPPSEEIRTSGPVSCLIGFRRRTGR